MLQRLWTNREKKKPYLVVLLVQSHIFVFPLRDSCAHTHTLTHPHTHRIKCTSCFHHKQWSIVFVFSPCVSLYVIFLKVDVELLNRGLVPCEEKKKTQMKMIQIYCQWLRLRINFVHSNIPLTAMEIKRVSFSKPERQTLVLPCAVQRVGCYRNTQLSINLWVTWSFSWFNATQSHESFKSVNMSRSYSGWDKNSRHFLLIFNLNWYQIFVFSTFVFLCNFPPHS